MPTVIDGKLQSRVAGIKVFNCCSSFGFYLNLPKTATNIEYAAKNIYFNTGSAKLLSKSFAPLNEVVKILNEDTNLKLNIEGHTDNVGKDEYNQLLSDNRAAAVKTYLVSKGIDESRITSQGFGETQPVADNNTAAGRTKNRRVVMQVNY